MDIYIVVKEPYYFGINGVDCPFTSRHGKSGKWSCPFIGLGKFRCWRQDGDGQVVAAFLGVADRCDQLVETVFTVALFHRVQHL